MTSHTDANQTAREAAIQVDELVRTRRQLKAAGEDMSAVDQRIKPYKTMYVRAGAKYGPNYEGMVKWFHEREQDAPAI